MTCACSIKSFACIVSVWERSRCSSLPTQSFHIKEYYHRCWREYRYRFRFSILHPSGAQCVCDHNLSATPITQGRGLEGIKLTDLLTKLAMPVRAQGRDKSSQYCCLREFQLVLLSNNRDLFKRITSLSKPKRSQFKTNALHSGRHTTWFLAHLQIKPLRDITCYAENPNVRAETTKSGQAPSFQLG